MAFIGFGSYAVYSFEKYQALHQSLIGIDSRESGRTERQLAALVELKRREAKWLNNAVFFAWTAWIAPFSTLFMFYALRWVLTGRLQPVWLRKI